MVELLLFFTFFKIGLFSFGGGASMIPLLQQEVVNHGWMGEEELLRYIAISESTPGPIAVNMATFVGSTQAGFLGALCATAGVVLPSFIIIFSIASAFKRFSEHLGVQCVLKSVRPIVVGMILASGTWLMLSAIDIHGTQDLSPDGVSLAITVLLALIMIGYRKIRKKNLGVIHVILIAAVLGVTATLIV